ncbi:penicillin acylase family protein [Paenibacillus sp. 481]|uniref:penicillin acylase family protein n=1 Tax=Paenibacillus sp. 481 TaxID=2835869 RepID=UPI001E41D79E|nr:penicillin acylase family protein [Paenibacillus sp. 481]UHA74055.1 penicillin acylase family protein [Paenibacillus sp. 481]
MTLFVSSHMIPFVEPNISHASPTKAEIVRDKYGVPTITAATNKELFELLGYAVAEDRLFQLELVKREAKGNLAEIVGKAFVEADKRKHLYGYTEAEYQQIFNTLAPQTKEIIQAYVDGVNRRITEVKQRPELLPFEFKKTKLEPSKWSVTDSLAVNTSLTRRFGQIGGTELEKLRELIQLNEKYDLEAAWNIFNDRYWSNDSKALTYIDEVPERTPTRTFTPQQVKTYISDISTKDTLHAIKETQTLASNALSATEQIGLPAAPQLASFAWVVSGKRTSTGQPLLAGDPEMGFSYPGIVYEAHLRGGTGFDVAGLHLVGTSGIPIGHNKHTAFTMMVGMGDNTDIYRETLNPNNREQYWYNGKWVDMEKRTETIRVAGQQPETITIYKTVHGPVIAPVSFDPKKSTSKHVYTWKYAHWMLDAKTVEGYLSIMQAKNVTDLQAGMAKVYTSLHLIGADSEGNIGYAQAGLVPVRPEGSDFRLPLSGTGNMEWSGKFVAMSKVTNPKKGYIAGWNNKSNPGFNNADNFYFGKYHRALWLERMLQHNNKVTPEDMEAMHVAVGSIIGTKDGLRESGVYAKDLLSYLTAAINKVPANDPYYDRLHKMVESLRLWDGRAVDSAITSTTFRTEQLIFETWLSNLLKFTFEDEFKGISAKYTYFDERFNILLRALDGNTSSVPLSRNYFDNMDTKNVVETADQLMVKSMKDTLDELSKKYASEDMKKWIEKRTNTSIEHPFLKEIGQFPEQRSGTYSFIVQFNPSKETVAAQDGKPKLSLEGKSRWPYGNSSFIGMDNKGSQTLDNPHLMDMLELYKAFKFKPMMQK